MPLGTPQGPSQAEWTIVADSVDRVAEYPLTFTTVVSTDNIDAEGVPAIVQKFVDLIDASDAFALRSAARTSTYAEAMTPTA